MMEIRNVFRETVPPARLIGKRYADADRQNGSFGHKWDEFFKSGWFGELERAGGKAEFDYIGMMRVAGGAFEYWIGMLFAPGAKAPDGFDFADIGGFGAAVFWIYGNPDSGELYGIDSHNRCLGLLSGKGWAAKDGGWCIERYNCPRFTEPDSDGNVVLDYYIETE
jgi:hypothetical protein